MLDLGEMFEEKTKLWNGAGVKPEDNPDHSSPGSEARDSGVARGSTGPVWQAGSDSVGSPRGHPDFVLRDLSAKAEGHATVREKIAHVLDLQIGWLMLVSAQRRGQIIGSVLCQSKRLDLPAGMTKEAVQCLCTMLQVEPRIHPSVVATSSLPLTLGGLGVGSTFRIRDSAHWRSWADCIEKIAHRHPPDTQIHLGRF